MMKRMTVVALALFLLASVPGTALAQEESPERGSTVEQADREAEFAAREAEWVDKLKARAIEAIDKRLVTIGELEAAVSSSEAVTPEHAEALLAELRSSAAGLETLAGEIRAADDLATLWALVPKIFEDYRIYAVVAPKVHLVLGGDFGVAVSERLDEVAVHLGEALGRLDDAGFDVVKGYELLAEMERLVAQGGEQAGKVAGMVIGLSPADYPDSTEVLRSAHGVLQSAGEDLRAGGATAQELGRYIKDFLPNADTE